VAYHRRATSAPPESRVTHQLYDGAGRLARQRDPRLFALLDAPSNLSTTYSLSNQPLCSDSVDAGWQVDLPGAAGQVIESWDQRGWHRRTEHDSSLRPVAMFEQGVGEVERCAERILWGAATDEEARHNRCGQPIRQDDPAGSRLLSDYGMSAAVLLEIRHFLNSFDPPDWPLVEAERDRLLEPGEGARASWSFLPSGELSHQTDAKGHTRHFTYDRAGQLHSVGLQRAGQSVADTLVNAIEYNAFGQIEQERAGNGMRTFSGYDPANGRLTNLDTQGPVQEYLQRLSYGYDPAGNITEIADAALPIQYFANQRIEPVRRFAYDTLYQLISATGWETAKPSLGPALPEWQGFGPPDGSRWCNYSETYYYDEAGNLLQRLHHGAVDDTLIMRVASHSNRSVKDRAGQPAIDELFDARGNLLELQPGQALQWNGCNQLAQVTQVARIEGADDIERYVYDSEGARLRKYREFTAKSIVHTAEVRYLPGIELHANSGTGERLQVISVQAGRCSVRLLHWDSPPPAGLDNDQWRYCFDDHLGSSAFEVDAQAKTISQEVYYPFGGTAWLAGRHEVETSYKTIRYSGKERDTTGLYYYGARYYAPWLQRWLSPDPAGDVDGLNFYRFVNNSPFNYTDPDGRNSVPNEAHYVWLGGVLPDYARSNIIKFKMDNPLWNVNVWGDSPEKLINGLLEDGVSSAILKNIAVHDVRDLIDSTPPYLRRDLSGAYVREMSGVYSNYAAASDLVRLAVLWRCGGIYMDIDVAVRGPVGNVASSTSGVAFLNNDFTGDETSSVMASQPYAPVMQRMLSRAVDSYTRDIGRLKKYGAYFSTEREDASFRAQTIKAPFDNFYLEKIWSLKRSSDLFFFGRQMATVSMTGPGIIREYMQSVSAEERDALRIVNSEIFGFNESPRWLPRWSPGIKPAGDWVRSSSAGKRASEAPF
jgi:insecticidal toxin complex protein TccC